MNQDQLLKQVKVERAEFEARLDEVEDAKRRYHRAIKRLYDAGMPLRDIADAVGLSHQRVHQIVGDGSLRGRVARKVAKNARAGGAGVTVLFLVIGSWIAGTAHPQSRAAAEADVTAAREFLETKLPDGTGESLSQKLDTLFNDGQR